MLDKMGTRRELRAGGHHGARAACRSANCAALTLALVVGCGDGAGPASGAPANGASSPTPSSDPASMGAPGSSAAGNGATGGSAGTPTSEGPNVEVGLDDPQTPLPTAPSGTGGSGGDVSAGSDAGADAEAPSPEEPPAFSPCPSDGTPCVIMPLGDSITFGVGSSGGGYRVELFRQALAGGKEITFVGTAPPNGPANVNGQAFPRAHQGHSGFTISGGGAGSLAGLVDASIAATNPDIILLMIGTNDINGNIDVAAAPSRLGALLDQITTDAPDALLVLAQIVPTTNAATNERVLAYNMAMLALVQQRIDLGRHLLLVGMFAPFFATPNFGTALMADFLHPNDAGYVVMGQTWYGAIERFLPE